MKKSLVLAMAMALGVTASAYAANPFSDVPAGHWAYDSVAKLAAAGVVDGYADGAFAGDKLITRYEMAQIVAKAEAVTPRAIAIASTKDFFIMFSSSFVRDFLFLQNLYMEKIKTSKFL